MPSLKDKCEEHRPRSVEKSTECDEVEKAKSKDENEKTNEPQVSAKHGNILSISRHDILR